MKIALERGDEFVVGIEPIDKHRAIGIERDADEAGEVRILVGDLVWEGDLTKDEDPPTSGECKAEVALWDTLGAFIVVEAPTGIVYTNQVGGTACSDPKVEGWLLPLHRWSWGEYGEGALGELTTDLWGKGALAGLAEETLTKIDAAIKQLTISSILDTGKFKLDRSRLEETFNGEAWVPVLTPWGRGWLTWENSD